MKEGNFTPPRPRHKLFREIFDNLLNELKNGTVPWYPPWQSRDEPGIPINAVTRRPYKGINVIILWLQSRVKGYKSNRWLTELQAIKVGGFLKSKQDSTPIIYFGGIHNDKVVVKYHSIYNIDQFNDLPKNIFIWQPIAKPEYILKNCGTNIIYTGQRAFHSSQDDTITLPQRKKFVHSEGYYSTAFHELIHWTGSEARLSRTEFINYHSNDRDRCVEELIAEIGSAFLCAETQVTGYLQHAQYINFYFELLYNNWKMLLKASRKAQEAADYIVDSALGRIGVVDYCRTGHISDIRVTLSRALGQYARYNNKIKIGMTTDPDKQWQNAKSDDDNWRKMLILYKTSSRKYALGAKKYLINYLLKSAWSELPEYPITIGNIMPGKDNYYIYALMK